MNCSIYFLFFLSTFCGTYSIDTPQNTTESALWYIVRRNCVLSWVSVMYSRKERAFLEYRKYGDHQGGIGGERDVIYLYVWSGFSQRSLCKIKTKRCAGADVTGEGARLGFTVQLSNATYKHSSPRLHHPWCQHPRTQPFY